MDANAALILAAFGILLICAEFCLPGWVVPGVAGGVFLSCGVYRLAQLEGSPAAAAALVLTLSGVIASGYGLLPAWAGLPLVLAVPWLCRRLVARGVILKGGASQHLSQKASAGDDLLRERIFAQSVWRGTVLGGVHRFLRGH